MGILGQRFDRGVDNLLGRSEGEGKKGGEICDKDVRKRS
jgi:hypothetical protein